jgi:hypothetical protein
MKVQNLILIEKEVHELCRFHVMQVRKELNAENVNRSS